MTDETGDTSTANGGGDVTAAEVATDRGEGGAAEPTAVERLALELRRRPRDGTLALVGGVASLFVAARAWTRGRNRAIVGALAGAGLIRHGIRQRRKSDDSLRELDRGSDDASTTSDDAHAATVRQGAEDPFESDDDSPGETDDDGPGETDDEIEFTTDPDQPAAKPGLEDEAEDPRRRTDEDVEIDLTESATAAEESEAAGPDPEQAQPTQTDPSEPDADAKAEVDLEEDDDLDGGSDADDGAGPDEDASHKRVDPDDEE